jgi:hypothetical protein
MAILTSLPLTLDTLKFFEPLPVCLGLTDGFRVGLFDGPFVICLGVLGLFRAGLTENTGKIH